MVYSGSTVGPKSQGGYIYRVMFIGTKNVPNYAFVEVIDPRTGRLINKRYDFNHGNAVAFASFKGDQVLIGDAKRLRSFSPDLKKVNWIQEFKDYKGFSVRFWPICTTSDLPDGNFFYATYGGDLFVIDSSQGEILEHFDLKELEPAVKPDPQAQSKLKSERLTWRRGKPFAYLRNIPALDGNDIFLITYGELIRLRYNPQTHHVKLINRIEHPKYSSSSPTLDTEHKRIFFFSFDWENRLKNPDPEIFCYNYDDKNIWPRWSVKHKLPFLPTLIDTASPTYLKSNGYIILNNLYGISAAYREVDNRDGSYKGEFAWATPHGYNFVTAASNNDNIVYSIDISTKKIYGLNGNTGAVIWEFYLGDDIDLIKPLFFIVDEHVLYVDYDEGMVALSDTVLPGEPGVVTPRPEPKDIPPDSELWEHKIRRKYEEYLRVKDTGHSLEIIQCVQAINEMYNIATGKVKEGVLLRIEGIQEVLH